MANCSRCKWSLPDQIHWSIVQPQHVFCAVVCIDRLYLCTSCSYLPQDSSLQSETVHFKRGVCQQFCLPSHTVNLSEWADEEVGSLCLSAEYWKPCLRLWCKALLSTLQIDNYLLSLLSCCLTWTKRFSPWWCRLLWTRGKASYCVFVTLMVWCESGAAEF